MLFAACLLAGVVAALWLAVELDARNRPEIVVTVPDSGGRVQVAISNGVKTPGVYDLPAGARLADLIDAAGGSDGSADLAAVNLSARLDDGQLVQLPELSASAVAVVASPATENQNVPMGLRAVDPRLNLNTATIEELDGLPGIGPVLAEAIIAERERRGGFTSIEDLVSISGISDRMVDELRDLVTV